MRRLLSLFAVLVVAAPVLADAEKAVRNQLDKLKAAGARVTVIKDDAVSRSFPSYDFVAVLFPQFPVARLAPEPLRGSNVYAATKDDKLTLLNSPKALQEFFKDGKYGEKEAALKDVMRSWLRLSSELYQDGFYRFRIEADSLKVTGGRVSGKIVVTEGGNGEITATIGIKDGMMSEWSEEMAIKRGMRPRCQATLLLHPEPLVRQLAEQDLLVIGRPAKPYLDEQRAKANPELQKAIDRVWEKILQQR